MNRDVRTDRLRVGAFLGGTGISTIGNVMAMVALPWFVLQTTGSATQTGLIGMATVLPSFLSGIIGGPLVDRLGGKRMSVIADIVSGLSLLAIPTVHLTVGLEFWQLFAFVLLGALLDLPGYTARRTLLPGFSERTGMRPEAINSAFEIMQAVAGILGPALAGLIIAPLGAVNLLWVTGAGFALSALAVYGVVPETSSPVESDTPGTSYVRQIKEGLEFIRRDRLLLSMAVVFAGTNLVNNGFYAVGLPVVIFEQFGDASRFGLLLSAMSVGTLLGGSIYGAIGHRLRAHRRMMVLVGFMLQPFLLLPYVIGAPFAVIFVAGFLSGLAAGPINPLSVTVRFERIPQRLHGRVFGTFSAITAVVSPLGMVLAGYLFEAVSVRSALITVIIVSAMVMLPLPLVRPFRQLDVAEDQESSVAAP